MATPKKNSKNNPDERKVVKQAKIVTSDICEKCSTKCQRGLNYLKQCSETIGKPHNGTPCYK